MILIALGANLPSRFGAPEQTFTAARSALARNGVFVTASSGVWKTAPVPASDQPWYSNAVIAVETDLNPQALYGVLKDIETEFGRVPGERNSARLLDLDFLAYEDAVITQPGLTIPHPRMHERGFVLLPLREIAPDWRHPVSRKTTREMIAALPAEDIGSCRGQAA